MASSKTTLMIKRIDPKRNVVVSKGETRLKTKGSKRNKRSKLSKKERPSKEMKRKHDPVADRCKGNQLMFPPVKQIGVIYQMIKNLLLPGERSDKDSQVFPAVVHNQDFNARTQDPVEKYYSPNRLPEETQTHEQDPERVNRLI